MIDRLQILMPPGSAKSTYASHMFPSWLMGVAPPGERIIAASHTTDLAEYFGRRVRNTIASPEYRLVFPHIALSPDTTAAGHWALRNGSEYLAAGVGKAIAGRRASKVIIDDPVKSREAADSEVQREAVWQWYTDDLYQRMLPNAAIVLIMTRWHDDDLGGRLDQLEKAGGDKWVRLRLPALAEDDDPLGREPGAVLWPEWMPLEKVKRVRSNLTARSWSALHQQRPQSEEGDYIKLPWVKRYERRPRHMKIYGASDYAVTEDAGDFTVHGVFGVDHKDDLYVLDWWRKQTDSKAWVDSLLDLVVKWKPSKWAEEKGQIIKGVGPFLQERMNKRKIQFIREQFASSTDKPTRGRSFQALMESGRVYWPETEWADEAIDELINFPTGVFDDQFDVCALVARMLATMTKGRVPAAPRPPRFERSLDELLRENDKHYLPGARQRI